MGEARVRQRDRREEGDRLLSAHPPELRCLGTDELPALVWQFDRPCRAIASTVLGGGVGERRWVVNVQVPNDYERTDPSQHLVELAEAAGCAGPGVGFLTAARVDRFTNGTDECVEAYATVGLQRPIWSAASEVRERPCPGTVNIVVFTPVALSDGALVNAATTATEAKVQALVEHDVAGTGTASDAVCVLAPVDGAPEEFCGPRSRVGASLARAVHRAVSDGVTRWRSATGEIS